MRSKWSVVAWSVPLILGLAGWANLSLAQDPVKKAEPPKPEPKKEEPKKADAPAEKDIVAVAKDTAALKTFYKLLDEAGLLKQLQEKGPFTVFAPTDEAFKKFTKLAEVQKDKAALKKLLLNHVARGKHDAAALKKMPNVKTLGDAELKITVKDVAISVDGGKVVKADMAPSNGTIHQSDSVVEAKADQKPTEP